MPASTESPVSGPRDAMAAQAAHDQAANSQSGDSADRWQVRLLGDVRVDNERGESRFLPTRAAAALLARLAMAPHRAHSREELIELLWPGVDLSVGRNRLRNVLSTLKNLLERDRQGSVLQADRQSVRVAPGALDCDALAFEAAWRSGRFDEARALYRGELMPGYFDEWIADERLRLAALLDRMPVSSPPLGPASSSAPSAGAAPAYLTRLFGRDLDRSDLRARILAHRLVTLVGPGGFGKTRLCAEVTAAMATEMVSGQVNAQALLPSAFDPVLFTTLVACTNRAEVLQQLAGTLGCEASLPAIERSLAGRRALLVLDNFEHLVDDASDVPQALLARLPRLHLLITSRSVLGLDGEHECVLGTLPLPTAEAGLVQAAGNPAVALFVDRARAARADFGLNADNLAAVVGLVQALEGMPLALELAAARCRTLSPADMLGMLSADAQPNRQAPATPALDLLERRGTRGDGDSRQASMARVVAWSWDLLGAADQSFLASLTVLRANFTAQAAAAAAGLTTLEAALQLDALASHSLLQVVRTPDGPDRFHLLAVIREFAGTGLSSAQRRALLGNLRRWLIDWARVEGASPLPSRIEPELPHVHAVLADALADPGEPQAGAEAMGLALALRDYWELDGMPPHSQQALERVLTELGDQWPAALRSDAHELLAYTSIGAGDGAGALVHAERALALAGADELRRGRALLRRVWVCLSVDYQAADQDAALGHAMTLALRTGNLPLQARTLHQQGILARYQHRNPGAAEALFAQAQALWISLGNQRLAHARLRNRAQCWAAQGLHAKALASFEQCEQTARADGDWVGIIDSTLGAATELSRLRRWPESVAKGAECIRVSWQRHHGHGLSYALWNVAYPMLRAGRTEDAVRLMAQASHYWTTHMGPLRAADQRDIVKIRRLAGVRLRPEQIDALWGAGTAMPVAEAVALALRDRTPR